MTTPLTRLPLVFSALAACGSPGGGGSGGTSLDAAPGAQDAAPSSETGGPADTGASSCLPQCGGNVCGPDGCGGFCGSCGAGTTCQGGVCVAGECGAGDLAVSGLFGVADGFAFDRATVSLEHKMDVDAFEDGCVTSIRIELARGFGCVLEVEAGEALAAGGGLRVTHVALSADSQCPGFPDDREGLYDDASAMTLMLVVPERYDVPDENAPESCMTTNLELRLEGALKDERGRLLDVTYSVIRMSGEMRSRGSTTARCPCAASCDGRACGEDGCGFSCGVCDSGERCDAASGRCLCVPDCGGLECGEDGCGGSCGGCGTHDTCQGGRCVACEPRCDGRTCGDDGCGGSCGGCAANSLCVGGQCACQPQCGGRECGDDGCGGSCGGCGANAACEGGVCRELASAECGDGSCDPGEETTCSADCSLGLCDGVCDIVDTFLCPIDCEVCGDGSCRGMETRTSCAADCAVGCGDGSCGAGESAASCPYDCSTCGDGICGGPEIAECPTDCLPF